MLVEYLTPQKFPKTWNGAKKKSDLVLQINFKTRQFYLSAELTSLLVSTCPGFTSIVILNTTEFDADKNPIVRYYIQPRLEGGFMLTGKNNAKNRSFTNLSLSAHLRDVWAIDFAIQSVKIPVFTEPVEVQGFKSFEFNLKNIQTCKTVEKP